MARRTDGFSLIELIVVVAVMAVVAAIAVPMLDVVQQRERSTATSEELQGLRTALEEHYQATGDFPDSIGALVTGGYLSGGASARDAMQDGWGNDYEFVRAGSQVTVRSLGPDGVLGPPDLEMMVTATRFQRAETMDEMETVHTALRNYESRRLADGLPNLPSTWYDGGPASALALLVTHGFLPNEMRFSTDAWGDTYVFTGTPSDRVTSSTIGAP